MAKTGLLHPIAAIIATEAYGSLPTYEEGFIIGRAIQADVSLNYGNNPLYADNREVNNDTDFTEGTITIGVDEFGETKDGPGALSTEQKLLGGIVKEVGEEEAKITELHSGSAVTSKAVGFGYIKTGQYPDNFNKYWEAVWFYKVKFTPTGESSTTKGSSTTWANPSITGRIYTIDGVDPKANMQVKARFTTEADAIAWLHAKANISGSATKYTVTVTVTGETEADYVTAGGVKVTSGTQVNAGTTLTVVIGTAGTTCASGGNALTNGGTVTVSADTAVTFTAGG